MRTRARRRKAYHRHRRRRRKGGDGTLARRSFFLFLWRGDVVALKVRLEGEKVA
jgi:hypothetical protein